MKACALTLQRFLNMPEQAERRSHDTGNSTGGHYYFRHAGRAHMATYWLKKEPISTDTFHAGHSTILPFIC